LDFHLIFNNKIDDIFILVIEPLQGLTISFTATYFIKLLELNKQFLGLQVFTFGNSEN